ncbi:syntaxin-binding protein 4-like [Lytechinus pictus]|uniref:syntaxin-binding protein 4-like n=1 Tax=Lytechinus pictus TaxID=7653 RepID=UPI0030B9E422
MKRIRSRMSTNESLNVVSNESKHRVLFMRAKTLKSSRVHLAEMALQEAENMELDYEEVIVMLDDELDKPGSKVKKMPRNMPPESVPLLVYQRRECWKRNIRILTD